MSAAGEGRIAIKRVYEAPAPGDGCRVLVDRVWPRGVSKEAAACEHWLREAAPSSVLRQWFAHRPERWEAFRRRYFAELDERPEVVTQLLDLVEGGPVTLVFAARAAGISNARALREYLIERRGAGP